MKAVITPLKGKYYGTVIEIISGSLEDRSINLWFASGTPSEREFERQGITKEQWDNNELVDDGWGGKSPIKQIWPCDSHYECDKTYKLAQEIVKMLEKME